MDNSTGANGALISYIDSLLWDEEQGGPAAANPPGGVGPGDAAEKAGAEGSDMDALRVLLIRVAGVPLAIALNDIAEVIDTKHASPLCRDANDGVAITTFKHRGRDIYAIDTRGLILPAGHPAQCEEEEWHCGHVVMLAGYDLGLMCDEVGEVVDLDRRGVEWRLRPQTRTWLAGMVKAHNHALLDIGELIQAGKLGGFSTH